MSKQNNLDLINGLLNQASSRYQFDTTTELALFELGYLIGLLSTLMEEDSHVYRSIKNKAKSE
jgi:hypothetical protein